MTDHLLKREYEALERRLREKPSLADELDLEELRDGLEGLVREIDLSETAGGRRRAVALLRRAVDEMEARP